MNQESEPNPDPMVLLALKPEAAKLLLLAAQKRRMDPSDYLSVLVDCERRGIKPAWRAPSSSC
jgi:hypothetical protein